MTTPDEPDYDEIQATMTELRGKIVSLPYEESRAYQAPEIQMEAVHRLLTQFRDAAYTLGVLDERHNRVGQGPLRVEA